MQLVIKILKATVIFSMQTFFRKRHRVRDLGSGTQVGPEGLIRDEIHPNSQYRVSIQRTCQDQYSKKFISAQPPESFNNLRT
jgi:hypothetical protein